MLTRSLLSFSRDCESNRGTCREDFELRCGCSWVGLVLGRLEHACCGLHEHYPLQGPSAAGEPTLVSLRMLSLKCVAQSLKLLPHSLKMLFHCSRKLSFLLLSAWNPKQWICSTTSDIHKVRVALRIPYKLSCTALRMKLHQITSIIIKNTHKDVRECCR